MCLCTRNCVTREYEEIFELATTVPTTTTTILITTVVPVSTRTAADHSAIKLANQSLSGLSGPVRLTSSEGHSLLLYGTWWRESRVRRGWTTQGWDENNVGEGEWVSEWESNVACCILTELLLLLQPLMQVSLVSPMALVESQQPNLLWVNCSLRYPSVSIMKHIPYSHTRSMCCFLV